MLQFMKYEYSAAKGMIQFSPVPFPVFMAPGQHVLHLVSGQAPADYVPFVIVFLEGGWVQHIGPQGFCSDHMLL